jgi:hypothetical protein
MKSLVWTLTLLTAGTFSATAFADHQYGSPYSLGTAYSAEQGYHQQLDHNAFHRQQAHEQFHDGLNHQNVDRQLNGWNNGYGVSGYGASFRTSPYSGGFNSWSGYSTPTYRAPAYGGYPSSSYGGLGGYGNSWKNGGSCSSAIPRW